MALSSAIVTHASSAAPEEHSLSLRAVLADTLFLEEEPIRGIVELTNEGAVPEISLPPLRPLAGHLALYLTPLPNGRAQRMGGISPGWSNATYELGSGETECEPIDLLDYFGGFHPSKRFSIGLGEETLSPGRYRLTGRLMLPPQGFRSRSLELSPVDFVVRPRREFPQDDSLMTALAGVCPPETVPVDSFRACCQRRLRSFVGSRMFVYVWSASAFGAPDWPPEEMLAVLRENGYSGDYRAALLAVICKIQRFEGHMDTAWLDRMEKAAQDPQSRRVLACWRNRMRRG